MSRPSTPGGFNLRRPPLPRTASGSRASTPQVTKPTVISLEDWEAKAPLTDEQVSSIASVRDQFGERPLPDKVSFASGCS